MAVSIFALVCGLCVLGIGCGLLLNPGTLTERIYARVSASWNRWPRLGAFYRVTTPYFAFRYITGSLVALFGLLLVLIGAVSLVGGLTHSTIVVRG